MLAQPVHTNISSIGQMLYIILKWIKDYHVRNVGTKLRSKVIYSQVLFLIEKIRYFFSKHCYMFKIVKTVGDQ